MLATLEMVRFHGITTAMPSSLKAPGSTSMEVARIRVSQVSRLCRRHHCCNDPERRNCVHHDVVSLGQLCWH